MTSSTFSNRILATLSLALLLAGGCVSVHASVPEVTLTQSNLAFDAMPVGVVGELSVSRSFTYEHSAINMPQGVDSDVRTVDVSLIANKGIADFSFIRNLRISLSDDVEAPVELASFVRSNGQENSNVLVLKVASASDVLAAFQTDSTSVFIEVTGTLPNVAWSMDVAIRFSGEFQYDL